MTPRDYLLFTIYFLQFNCQLSELPPCRTTGGGAVRGYSIWTVLVILGSTPKNYHTMLLLHCLCSFWLFSRFSRLRGSEVSPFRVFAFAPSLFAAPRVVSDLPERCCGGAAVPPALASSRVYQQRAETQPKEIVTSVGRVLTLRPSTSN